MIPEFLQDMNLPMLKREENFLILEKTRQKVLFSKILFFDLPQVIIKCKKKIMQGPMFIGGEASFLG